MGRLVDYHTHLDPLFKSYHDLGIAVAKMAYLDYMRGARYLKTYHFGEYWSKNYQYCKKGIDFFRSQWAHTITLISDFSFYLDKMLEYFDFDEYDKYILKLCNMQEEKLNG